MSQIYMTLKQMKTAIAALESVQIHRATCDTQFRKWEDEAIFRLVRELRREADRIEEARAARAGTPGGDE